MKKVDFVILFIATIIAIVVYQYKPPIALLIAAISGFGVFIVIISREPNATKYKRRRKPPKITHRRKY